MKKYFAIITSPILFVVFLLITSTPASALPLVLQLTIDDLTKGRAVLSGNIDDTFADPAKIEADFPKIGTNWEVNARLLKVTLQRNTEKPVVNYDLFINARHISNPAPHPGEATPGLLLGGSTGLAHNSIRGNNPDVFGPFGLQNNSAELIHPGSIDHTDVLKSHLDDLNGAAPGYLTADNQLSARIDLAHTPEPSSLFLLGYSLLGLAGFQRFRRS